MNTELQSAQISSQTEYKFEGLNSSLLTKVLLAWGGGGDMIQVQLLPHGQEL